MLHASEWPSEGTHSLMSSSCSAPCLALFICLLPFQGHHSGPEQEALVPYHPAMMEVSMAW
jgi:hypothetical protein